MKRIPSAGRLGLAALALFAAACTTSAERNAWREVDREAEYLSGRDGAAPPRGEAQPSASLEKKTDLAELLRFAALHHPGLRAAFERWKAALERVPQARRLPDPVFTYGNYIREVETRVGAQEQSFGLVQGIPWPGELTRKAEAALRNARVEKFRYDAVKFKLFYEVKRAYYEYDYLSRALDIVRENIQLLRNMEASVRARYRAGVAENPALIQLQVELGRLEDQEKSLEALRPARAARLNAAVGRDPDLPLPWPEEAPGEPPAQDRERLRTLLLQVNPELEAARARIDAAEAERDVAETGYYPDFGIGARYIQTDRRHDADPGGNGEDPFLLTFQVSIPLWRGAYGAAVREAEARRESAAREREDLENRLSADLAVALFEYDDAARKLNLFRDTLIPKAEQSMKTSQRAFSAGKAGFLDMLDAERRYLEFRLLAKRALADRNIRLAELEMLCGRELRAPKATSPGGEAAKAGAPGKTGHGGGVKP